jgi:hypothetical protein
MIGLIAARICADHFERVVIIEADEGADTEFPATAETKRDAHGNKKFVTRRSRVAQTFGVHCTSQFLSAFWLRFDTSLISSDLITLCDSLPAIRAPCTPPSNTGL